MKPSIAGGLRESTDGMRTFLADQLRVAGADGVDPDRTAAGLLALDAQLSLLFGRA